MPKSANLGSNVHLVIGKKVVVEFRTVKHARKRLGRRCVRFGCIAVVGACWWCPSARFRRLFTCAINRRLLRETLVRQEIGLDSVLSRRRLGCERNMRVSQSCLLH